MLRADFIVYKGTSDVRLGFSCYATSCFVVPWRVSSRFVLYCIKTY